jgi:hypothetical protein
MQPRCLLLPPYHYTWRLRQIWKIDAFTLHSFTLCCCACATGGVSIFLSFPLLRVRVSSTACSVAARVKDGSSKQLQDKRQIFWYVPLLWSGRQLNSYGGSIFEVREIKYWNEPFSWHSFQNFLH